MRTSLLHSAPQGKSSFAFRNARAKATRDEEQEHERQMQAEDAHYVAECNKRNVLFKCAPPEESTQARCLRIAAMRKAWAQAEARADD